MERLTSRTKDGYAYLLNVKQNEQEVDSKYPNGAGRLMSRTKAREILSLQEYQESMGNIYTTSVSKETIDEAPMAYKSLDEIVECIEDSVEIVNILKPIYNFKASE